MATLAELFMHFLQPCSCISGPAEVAAHDALAGQEVEGRQRDWPVVLLHAQDDRLALALTPRIRMMRSYLLENGGCIWRDRSMG